MNQDILKQLLSKLSDIEARLQVIEEFNSKPVDEYYSAYAAYRNPSSYPALKDCQRKFENMDLLDYQFPPSGLRE